MQFTTSQQLTVSTYDNVCSLVCKVNALRWSSPLLGFTLVAQLRNFVWLEEPSPCHVGAPNKAKSSSNRVHASRLHHCGMHDVVYLPLLFVACEFGFRLCLHCNATQARSRCGLSQWPRETWLTSRHVDGKPLDSSSFPHVSPALTESNFDSFSHVSLVVGSLLRVSGRWLLPANEPNR